MRGCTSVRVSALSLSAAGLGNLYTPVEPATARLDEVSDAVAQAGVPIPADVWHELRAACLLPGCVPFPGGAR